MRPTEDCGQVVCSGNPTNQRPDKLSLPNFSRSSSNLIPIYLTTTPSGSSKPPRSPQTAIVPTLINTNIVEIAPAHPDVRLLFLGKQPSAVAGGYPWIPTL
ncbi:hypothetical protein PGTUg99_022132 [Puccinia graminis f. sp. tritici]|uniref:Uncharacterized protein n=1 Tax=Puccinia graminis f. sp. tritici TaxID=56615 RepID=A0A5B0S867_PUCGR|nr:hypothetical protein PGTUg99_022132 [Puccinia graminis f. sp. tritici]